MSQKDSGGINNHSICNELSTTIPKHCLLEVLVVIASLHLFEDISEIRLNPNLLAAAFLPNYFHDLKKSSLKSTHTMGFHFSVTQHS